MEFIPREKLIEEYQLYTKFLYLLSILGYKKPELTLHTKVTELVWKLYEYEDIPEELLIPEVQLVE
jgi:glutathionylspermidine synthase